MRINREIGASYLTGLASPAKVGERITWIPRAWSDTEDPRAIHELHGTVIYVNAAHRYYAVEAVVGGRPLRECFKF